MATAVPVGAADLILYQPNTHARTQSILRNLDFILAQPFDGVVLNIPASWSVMQPGVTLTYDSIYRSWLEPLKTRFNSKRRNYVLAVVREAADPFDSWTTVINNWVALARAARDSGAVGLFFDNEEYFEQLWDYPGDVKYPSRSLSAYQAQYRERGKELMNALIAAWPAIRIVTTHGPYVSEPRTPNSVSLLQIEPRSNRLSGFFFTGMLEAAGTQAQVIDGGEVYQYRSESDFSGSYTWRKDTLPQVASTALIPSGLRSVWRSRLRVAYGVYDQQWKSNYPMSPSILQTSLSRALARSDGLVWLFVEGDGSRNYLAPGGVSSSWTSAIRAAR